MHACMHARARVPPTASTPSTGFERRAKASENDWALIYAELVNGYRKHLEVRAAWGPSGRLGSATSGHRGAVAWESARPPSPICPRPRCRGSAATIRLTIITQVRAAIDVAVAPTWTDLMVWAVLAGSERLSRVLWAKSHEPLRAAIICSQLCRRLAALPHLRGDEEHLEHFADMCAMTRSEIARLGGGAASSHRRRIRLGTGRLEAATQVRHSFAAVDHVCHTTHPMHHAGTKTGRSGCSTR